MDISKMLQEPYAEGIIEGIQLMKRRMEIAAETKTPIHINNKAYFVQDDIDHLEEMLVDIPFDKSVR